MSNHIINTERQPIKLYFEALEFAAWKHRFQKRKGARGIPYINHPIEVSSLIIKKLQEPPPELVMAAILHDTLEDTDTTPEELAEKFGEKVLHLVEEVSDDMHLPSKQRKQLQVEHAGALSMEARAIKIADKTCNIRDIVISKMQWPKVMKVNYIRWAIEVIQQISASHPPLEAEFIQVLQFASAKLNIPFELPTA